MVKNLKIFNRKYLWMAIPTTFSIFLVVVGFVFTQIILLGFCSRTFVGGGSGSTLCADSYPYYQDVGSFVSTIALFYVISFLYVLYLNRARFSKIWVIITTIVFVPLISYEMVTYTINSVLPSSTLYGTFLLFLTIIGGLAFGVYDAINHKFKRKGPFIIGFILLIPVIFGILFILSFNGFW